MAAAARCHLLAALTSKEEVLPAGGQQGGGAEACKDACARAKWARRQHVQAVGEWRCLLLVHSPRWMNATKAVATAGQTIAAHQMSPLPHA